MVLKLLSVIILEEFCILLVLHSANSLKYGGKGRLSALQKFQMDVLNEHNAKRRLHHARPLKLNSKLNKAAMNLAAQIWRRGGLKRRYPFTNIFMGCSPEKIAEIGKQVTDIWYNDICSNNFNFDRPENNVKSKSFSKVIWQTSTNLGVGLSTKLAKDGKRCIFVVAVYNPPGNVHGSFRTNVMKGDFNPDYCCAVGLQRPGCKNQRKVSAQMFVTPPKYEKVTANKKSYLPVLYSIPVQLSQVPVRPTYYKLPLSVFAAPEQDSQFVGGVPSAEPTLMQTTTDKLEPQYVQNLQNAQQQIQDLGGGLAQDPQTMAQELQSYNEPLEDTNARQNLKSIMQQSPESLQMPMDNPALVQKYNDQANGQQPVSAFMGPQAGNQYGQYVQSEDQPYEPDIIYPTRAANNAGTTTMQLINKDEFRQKSLTEHNKLRRLHDAPDLKLNPEMCEEADEFANMLSNVGDIDDLKPKDGQNLFYECYQGTSPPSPTDAVKSWYGEVCNGGNLIAKRKPQTYDFSKEDGPQGASHFTQMVWRNSSDYCLGMSTREKKEGYRCTYYVARYRPAGNMMSKFMDNVHKGLFSPVICADGVSSVDNILASKENVPTRAFMGPKEATEELQDALYTTTVSQIAPSQQQLSNRTLIKENEPNQQNLPSPTELESQALPTTQVATSVPTISNTKPKEPTMSTKPSESVQSAANKDDNTDNQSITAPSASMNQQTEPEQGVKSKPIQSAQSSILSEDDSVLKETKNSDASKPSLSPSTTSPSGTSKAIQDGQQDDKASRKEKVDYSDPKETFREQMLKLHNYFRQIHKSPPLVLTESLNDEARKRAQAIAVDHRLRKIPPGETVEDENVYSICQDKNKELSPVKVFVNWYRQVCRNKFQFSNKEVQKGTNEFAHVVWPPTTELGIDYATRTLSPEKLCIYVVAKYRPGRAMTQIFKKSQILKGNFRSQKMCGYLSDMASNALKEPRKNLVSEDDSTQEEIEEEEFSSSVSSKSSSKTVNEPTLMTFMNITKDENEISDHTNLHNNTNQANYANATNMAQDVVDGTILEALADVDQNNSTINNKGTNTSETGNVNQMFKEFMPVTSYSTSEQKSSELSYGKPEEEITESFNTDKVFPGLRKVRISHSGKYRGLSKAKTKGFSKRFKKEALELYNVYRDVHESPPLVMDSHLTKAAENEIEDIINKNKSTVARRGGGRNGLNDNFYLDCNSEKTTSTAKKVVENWYRGACRYNFDKPDGESFDDQVSKFLQMIWKGTSKVGFGIRLAETKDGLLCTYVIAKHYPQRRLNQLKRNINVGTFSKLGMCDAEGLEEIATRTLGIEEDLPFTQEGLGNSPMETDQRNASNTELNEVKVGIVDQGNQIASSETPSVPFEYSNNLHSEMDKQSNGPSLEYPDTYKKETKSDQRHIKFGTLNKTEFQKTRNTGEESGNQPLEEDQEEPITKSKTFPKTSSTKEYRYPVALTNGQLANEDHLVGKEVEVPGEAIEANPLIDDGEEKLYHGHTLSMTDSKNVNPEKEMWRLAGTLAHNRLRKIHEAPALQLDSKMSDDADIFALKLAQELSESKDYNDNIMLRHSNTQDGENLAMRCDDENDLSPEEATQTWYSEECAHPYNYDEEGPQEHGHFTQVVWKNSRKFGIGKANFNGTGTRCTVIVARYRPAGNYMHRFRLNVRPGAFKKSVCPRLNDLVQSNLVEYRSPLDREMLNFQENSKFKPENKTKTTQKPYSSTAELKRISSTPSKISTLGFQSAVPTSTVVHLNKNFTSEYGIENEVKSGSGLKFKYNGVSSDQEPTTSSVKPTTVPTPDYSNRPLGSPSAAPATYQNTNPMSDNRVTGSTKSQTTSKLKEKWTTASKRTNSPEPTSVSFTSHAPTVMYAPTSSKSSPSPSGKFDKETDEDIILQTNTNKGSKLKAGNSPKVNNSEKNAKNETKSGNNKLKNWNSDGGKPSKNTEAINNITKHISNSAKHTTKKELKKNNYSTESPTMSYLPTARATTRTPDDFSESPTPTFKPDKPTDAISSSTTKSQANTYGAAKSISKSKGSMDARDNLNSRLSMEMSQETPLKKSMGGSQIFQRRLSNRGEDDNFVAKEGLRVHNILRAIHESPPLSLNQKLSSIAKSEAKKLIHKGGMSVNMDQVQNIKRQVIPGFDGVGKNLIIHCDGGGQELSTNEAVLKWYREACKEQNEFQNGTYSGELNQFTQIVWHSSTELGIGKAMLSIEDAICTVIIALYKPAGNRFLSYRTNVKKGSFEPVLCKKGALEKLLKPTSPDPTIAATDELNLSSVGPETTKKHGIISGKSKSILKETYPPSNEETSSVSLYGARKESSPNVQPIARYRPAIAFLNNKKAGLGALSKLKLSDRDFVLQALKEHNKLRHLHGSPPLSLDGYLTARAQTLSNQVAHFSLPKYRRIDEQAGLGENLYSLCSPSKQNVPGAKVTLHWYKEVCNPGYDFGKGIPNKGANHFSRLVWKNSEKMGIGRTTIKKDGMECTYVAALYYPTGNTPGSYRDNVKRGHFPQWGCTKLRALMAHHSQQHRHQGVMKRNSTKDASETIDNLPEFKSGIM